MKSDLDLMAAFRQGDSTAFLKLVRRHHLNVFNFIQALVRAEGVAEHLTHETFLRVVVEKGDVPPAQTFLHSLLRVASFCWLDYHRRTNPQTPLLLPAPAASEESAAATDFRRLFDHLPPELRVVVALSDVSGLSYQEIAQVLEIAVDSVKNRMNEGYGRLRALMHPAPRS